MDLNEILNKTKKVSERAKRSREPVYIATTDRPYEKQNISTDKAQQKTVTNCKQTDNKPITNDKQTGNKPVTNRKQTDNKIEQQKNSKNETGNKPVTQPVTELVTNRKQTDNKPVTNSSFSALVGLQRSVLLLIYNECKKSLSKVTDPLTLEYIGSHVGANKNTVKTTANRLSDKNFIIKKEFKCGRGGWTKYELPQWVYHELLQNETVNKPITNRKQTDNKPVTQPVTQPVTSLSSSSSSNYINTTTTELLPNEWKNINISGAGDFGFTENHLVQLVRAGGCEPKMVEDSIEYFLFDLKHNDKAKEIRTTPLVYFMSIMKKTGVYSAPDNYESPRDLAMRLYVEKQTAIQEKKIALENKLQDVEFQKWVGEVTEDEKNKIIPDNVKNINFSAPKTAALRSYFQNNIWPNLRAKIMESNLTEI